MQILTDVYFEDNSQPEYWEWGVYREVYNPSQPIREQGFSDVVADLSSDLGPIHIGQEKGYSFTILFIGTFYSLSDKLELLLLL